MVPLYKKTPASPQMLLYISGICFFLTFLFAARSYSFGMHSVRTEGKIVAFMMNNHARGATVVNFQTDAGEAVEFLNHNIELPFDAPPTRPSGDIRVAFADSRAPFKSDRVTVLYQKDDPHNAIIDTFFSRWVFSTSFFMIGLIMGATGLNQRNKQVG